ncbi:MAG: AMP-binding protein [Actinomycetota bacterium]|nr:AMP-binding protein [Actinomycetota bacterium]
MRVDESVVVDAETDEVWETVSDLSCWERLFATATRWEHEGGPESGLGARYQLRMKIGSAHVGSLIEVVECDAPGDLAWNSITGLDMRGRWRLRETDDGQTRVSLRLSYQAPGGILGMISDRVSSPMVSSVLSETLERLKREVEGDRYMGDGGRNDGGLASTVVTGLDQALETVRTVWSAGLVRPTRPDRIVRSLMAIQRWGYTPATGYITNAARYPDQDAIVDDLGRLTFAEVHDRTNRMASALADAGVLEGDGVAIMCRNHRYFVETVVALSKLGAHALFLNTAFAGPQLTEVVKREKPVAVIYDEEFAELLEDAGKRRKRFVAWYESEDPADPTLEDLIADGDPADPVPPEEPGRVVILTSGTTGTPKGASRKQAESIGPAIALLSRIPLRANEKALIAAPLFHSWGFAHFTLGMALSHTLVLQRRFKPENTLAGIAQHQVQSCPMVPVMVQRIMDLPEEARRKYDTSSLRAVPLSGSALPGELAIRFMDEFGDILYNLYGSTEVAWATIATPDDLRAAPGTAGKPPMGTVLRIYDENGNEVPEGREGRIFVANEMLFEGYTGGGSKDVIDGLMSTGDVGYIDEEGRLFVSGRDDEMIVSGGENVFPREVEDTISNMKGVSEVAVIGVDDEEWGQRLKAFVVTQGSGGPGEDEIKKHVKSNLAGYKVPRDVEFMDELPRNATGKILKRELAEREEEETSSKS